MNPNVQGMYCILCGKELETGAYPFGCESCRKKGTPASVSLRYSNGFSIDQSRHGMARYHSVLPYGPNELEYLGEGGTPLVPLSKLSGELGIYRLFSKNEFQNPTGSHKDRMNPFIIAYAREMNYSMVAAASSGNEGISLSCYAGAARIPCTIVATKQMNALWKKAITATGAKIVFTSNSHDRWTYIREYVKSGEWLSATNMIDPPVGSSCYGVQGYKTIAYELYEQMPDKLADYIMVPVGRGDLLWGIYEGFADLKKAGLISEIPALVAVEPFPRLERVKSVADCGRHYQGSYGATPSIGGDTVTVQSYLALKKSGGFAVSATQELVQEAINRMGQNGLYLEEASALSVVCLEHLIQAKKISKESSVVLLATSYGFKNII